MPVVPSPLPRLLDRVRQALRLRHYSPRTEEAYVARIRRYILYSPAAAEGSGRHCLPDAPSGTVRRVELHWHEAHGIGRRSFKIKAHADQS